MVLVIKAGIHPEKKVVFQFRGPRGNEPGATCVCLKLSHLGVNLQPQILLKYFSSFTADVYTFNAVIEAKALMVNEKFEEKWNNILVRKPHFVF